MPFVDTDTGEVYGASCPLCEKSTRDAEAQVVAMEREARNYRAKITRMERDAERNLVAKRDGATWKAILEYWCEAFPNKRVSSRGIKSARATKFFQRLEAGATPEDVRYAITAATVYPYVVYGKRVRSGSKSDLASDLQDVVSVGNDAQFDRLVEIGRGMAKEPGW